MWVRNSVRPIIIAKLTIVNTISSLSLKGEFIASLLLN